MIAEVRIGVPAYHALIRPLHADPALVDEMWADGGHELEEHRAKTWWMAIEQGRPVAWCAAQPADDGRTALRCTDNYHRRGWRDSGLYEQVFLARHEAIRLVSAVTLLHTGPVVDLHLAHGWELTGLGGDRPGFDQQWVELIYKPVGR